MSSWSRRRHLFASTLARDVPRLILRAGRWQQCGTCGGWERGWRTLDAHAEREHGETLDMRQPGESFCAECPDHEGCMTGYPCWVVRQAHR